jgi:hypothetical protein
VATWDDVREIAGALPGVTEGTTFGTASWKVGGKGLVVWERPLRKRDLEELADAAPDGEVLGAAVVDEGEKRALLDGEPELFFTTSHFDGYAAVLVRLDAIDRERLRELVTEAWRARAPRRLIAGSGL